MTKTRKDPDVNSVATAQDGLDHKKKSGQKVVVGVVITLVALIVFVLVTAFVWPGWATNSNQAQDPSASSSQKPTAPKIKAKELPEDITELIKSMPDAVNTYARQDISDSTAWSSALPLEEHSVVYSTGTTANDITLNVAQWAKSDNAKTQYSELVGGLSGKKIAAGSVKVSGQATGSYEVHESAEDPKKAVAVWQNDTCVFQVTGNTADVKSFYKSFPF